MSRDRKLRRAVRFVDVALYIFTVGIVMFPIFVPVDTDRLDMGAWVMAGLIALRGGYPKRLRDDRETAN